MPRWYSARSVPACEWKWRNLPSPPAPWKTKCSAAEQGQALEQSRQVEQTKLAHAARVLEQLSVRKKRLTTMINVNLEKPDTDALAQVRRIAAEVQEQVSATA